MSYDSVRECLRRMRQQPEERDTATETLIEALDQLTAAIESDLAQIKGALSHVAHLLERGNN
jgi:Arc/MetJ-type ribon-helix-helix transcriptional regulator